MMDGLRRAGHTVVPGVSGRFFALSRTVFGQRPDAVHLDWPGSYYLRSNTLFCLLQTALFALDLWLLRLSNVPLVWTVHNLAEHETAYPRLDAWAKRLLARAARRIRVFSREQIVPAASRLGVPTKKIVAIPEGSYVGFYTKGQTRAEARVILGLPLEAFVVLHFGNLRPYKGSVDLIQAFRKVAEPTDQLVLAGPAHNPGYVEVLRSAAGSDPRIHLHPGFVPEASVQTYFAAADLAAFPFARIDNSGTVILAMGFGLPCLAPAVGAVATRLAAQPQLLFAPGALASTLGLALNLPKTMRDEIGKNNRAQVQSHLWEDFAHVFHKL